ncbi:MAG: hypothetical protein K2I81_03400 [Alphaproteobacteria bacterium]|nr:hypothetical protein [Alphaproteobacteria bacterium]
MKFIKKYLKILIGVAALLLVFTVFVMSQRSENLEGAPLKKWPSASLERRIAAAKILTGTDQNAELIVQCIDKIATLPDSGEMAIRDAASLCYTGVQLKENL